MYKYEELRKLPTGSLYRISETLETNGDWRKVMSLIPKDPNSEKFEPKYNAEQMRAVEEHAKAMRKTCAEVLFDEWGTSGRNRPTIALLQSLIQKACIYKASVELAAMLNEPPPPRPSTGPAAKIDTDVNQYLKSDLKRNEKKHNSATESTAQMKSSGFFNIPAVLKSIGAKTTASVQTNTQEYSSRYSEATDKSADGFPNFDVLLNDKKDAKKSVLLNDKKDAIKSVVYPAPPTFRIDTTILENKTLIQFDYNKLKEITTEFSDIFIYGPHGPTGKIGSGAFGDVYAGFHPEHGLLAVKKIKNIGLLYEKPELVSQTFNAEVKCLAQLRHENIVPIVGYSIQKDITSFPSLCIVCQYVEGGSLELNLASESRAKRLMERERINIIVGTVRGLRYIHNRDSAADIKLEGVNGDAMIYIHGDVKSPNILLTKDFQPKLCDFGLAKQFTNTTISSTVMGTTPYMSPERLRGGLTQKVDIYSLGIVLLELLTSQQCLVRRNNEILNIQDYIAETAKGDITQVLTPEVTWTKALQIYELAKKCLIYDYTVRPNIDQVYEEVIKISAEE